MRGLLIPTDVAHTGSIRRFISNRVIRAALAISCVLLLPYAHSLALAQYSTTQYSPEISLPAASQPAPPQLLPPDQLTNLVAPVALYPDPLLSQVLVACTYPLELVEAQQWLQQNRILQGRLLIEAAKQQDWDPSVQVLVAFPDVMALLNRNIRWTTNLGNAFLAQQPDVMNAIQNLRAQVMRNGQLASTPQLAVNTETQGDQRAIEIQPADPQTMYVPSYDPSALWGPPAEGSYPALPYPGNGYGPDSGYGSGNTFGSIFGTLVNLAGMLPGFPGLLGAKSWGWALNWLVQALFINNSFFSNFGFHNFSGGYGESSLWVHNVTHRLGVPYASSMVAGMYGGRNVPGRMAIPSNQGGSGGRGYGSGPQASPAAQRPFAPRTFSGSQSFQPNNRTARWDNFSGNNRIASAGQYGRAYSQPSRSSNGGFQPSNRFGRDPYFANSANNRARSYTDSRSFASNYGGYANSGTARMPAPSRSFTSNSSWGQQSHFSAPRMSSQHGSSSWQRPSRSQHFSAPKFSAPHSSKSHGGGHFSRGHSGHKSHRK